MNRIWAPWRKAYLRPDKKPSRGCLFCHLNASTPEEDAFLYILQRSRYSFAVLNRYPYNNGHVMIVPKRHVANIHQLNDLEKLDWLSLYEEIQRTLKAVLKAHGFNVGINIGDIAGAGYPKHLHLHIVPRWKGDVNFMPVIGDTKVISESLDSVYQALKNKLKGKKSH